MPALSRARRRTNAVLLSFFTLIVLLGAVPTAVRAADATDVFTVANVHVDESGAAAADARTVALSRGERRAFDELMRRYPDRSTTQATGA